MQIREHSPKQETCRLITRKMARNPAVKEGHRSKDWTGFKSFFPTFLPIPNLIKAPKEHWLLWDLRAVELILRDAVELITQFYLME